MLHAIKNAITPKMEDTTVFTYRMKKIKITSLMVVTEWISMSWIFGFKKQMIFFVATSYAGFLLVVYSSSAQS